MCVCVCEREREKEKERGESQWQTVNFHLVSALLFLSPELACGTIDKVTLISGYLCDSCFVIVIVSPHFHANCGSDERINRRKIIASLAYIAPQSSISLTHTETENVNNSGVGFCVSITN